MNKIINIKKKHLTRSILYTIWKAIEIFRPHISITNMKHWLIWLFKQKHCKSIQLYITHSSRFYYKKEKIVIHRLTLELKQSLVLRILTRIEYALLFTTKIYPCQHIYSPESKDWQRAFRFFGAYVCLLWIWKICTLKWAIYIYNARIKCWPGSKNSSLPIIVHCNIYIKCLFGI